MKKYFIFCCLYFSTEVCVKAQTGFQKAYYLDAYFNPCNARPTADGGFILTGNTAVNFWTNTLLIKTNSNGDTLWTKNYGLPNVDDLGTNVIQTKDGGYFVTGSSLLKTDSTGQPFWNKTISGITFLAQSAIESPNGDIIVTGRHKLTQMGDQVILLKMDSAGNQVFAESFGDSSVNEEALSIQPANDGGYILAGVRGNNALLIKTDSAGTITWARTYGGTANDDFKFAQQTPDGGYLAVGVTGINSQAHMFLVKVDSNGILVWSKEYQVGLYLNGYAFLQTADNHFFIAGESSSGVNAGALVKVDSLGNLVWAKSYSPGPSNDIFFNSISATADSGLMLFGHFGPVNSREYLCLLKTDTAGNTGCNVANLNVTASNYFPGGSPQIYTPVPISIYNFSVLTGCMCDSSKELCSTLSIDDNKESQALKIYPDPFSDKLNILTGSEEQLEIEIFDIASRKILSVKFKNSAVLNTEPLSEGIYFYRLRNKKAIINKGKLIKE